jgi:selenocysteine-specific elongation factor
MTSIPRSIVIGTAGHIDHGKTTLVRALTGTDPDRLPEEKRRGITIDLGYASFDTQAPDGSQFRISFVDVPGHHLFIRNMLAGAGCVPVVMLVVAADEGVMRQTVEHLRICELLGISRGLTVITKADAVSASQLQEVTSSIETFLNGTFLDGGRAPLLPVSAATGEGLQKLRAELVKLAMRTSVVDSGALMRMPLDRSFIMKGFGTVATGTLISGAIHQGEMLQLEPQGRAVRVRGLQTHGRAIESAPPGSRVAVNLSGIDATQVRRGQTLVSPGTIAAVDMIDVEVRLLKSASALKHRASVHFHAFTFETMARVALYGYEAMQPGTVRLMRIKLGGPMVLVPGDRFVLRQPSPTGTIGGGCVLDAHSVPHQRKAVTLAWLEQLKTSRLTEQVVLRVGRRKTDGVTLNSLSAETGWTADELRRQISPSLESGELLLLPGDLLISHEAFVEATSAITARLQIQAVKSSELRSQTALSAEVFNSVLGVLIREQKARVCNETVSIFHAGDQSPDAETARLAAVAQAYESAGLAPPSVLEVAQRLDFNDVEMRRLVTVLQRNGTLVRMGSDNLFFHSGALKLLAAQLSSFRGSLMDVARFKQLTGLSRKYAIPLLEYLDRQRITRIQGDRRLIL